MADATDTPASLPLKARFGGFLLAALMRLIYVTSLRRFLNREAIERQFASGEPFILVSWHNRNILAPFGYLAHRRGRRRFMPLASASRDGSLAASMSSYLTERLEADPAVTIHYNTEVTALHGEDHLEGVTFTTADGEQHIDTRALFIMIGAAPNTGWLSGLVETDEKGFVKTGAEVGRETSFETGTDGIFAVGDVTERVALTPVAIHEAMCFVETAFKDNPTSPDHDEVATAVFSQPEIGTVGLSEDDAARKFEKVDVYKASFRPMRHTLAGRNEKMLVKLVVDGISKRVLGAHILGPDAGEMAQLLGIAVKARLTKADFDRTNVRGSGISLGHPVGATGGRMLATLARELELRGARYGLETMCIGGGQGLAAVFERVAD